MMREFDPQIMLRLVLVLPLFLFSLTVHEFAHAWMAKRCGDPTAEDEGRLTLDPVAHIDPVGLICFLLSAMVGFGFGWAKPVPVRLGNCPRPLSALYWIALAGPLSNLLQAGIALLLLMLLGELGTPVVGAVIVGVAPIFGQTPLGMMGILACLAGYFVQINLVLALFNLIPVPPLDGGRILVSVAPYKLARFVASLEQYGFTVLLVLMMTGVIGMLFQYTLVPLLHGVDALLTVMGLGIVGM